MFWRPWLQSCSDNLIEDYTQIFYMIDKGDIPSIQCKMSLRGHKSMRKAEGLSLIFIDISVPAPTPRLNSTETSLQLSENITRFAVCQKRLQPWTRDILVSEAVTTINTWHFVARSGRIWSLGSNYWIDRLLDWRLNCAVTAPDYKNGKYGIS
jgi:hypothetical protein